MDRTLDEQKAQDLDVAPPAHEAPQQDHGHAAVLANLHTLGPGDSELLAQRLRDFPELHDQIIEWAMAHLGNATVHDALAAVDKGSAKAAVTTEDDGFVAEQIEVMAQTKSDEEFAAYQMGVMAAEQQEQDDNAFVAEQIEQMEAEQSDEEFVAFQMGEMAKAAEDDQFVKDQIAQMDQDKNDEAFVAEQMGVMAQQADDKQFVDEQIAEMQAQQSDDEFVRYQLGVMEAEQRAHNQGAEQPKSSEAAVTAQDERLIETLADTPTQAPELLGVALVENPALRAPILEEATQVSGAEAVTEALTQEPEQAEAEQETDAEVQVEATAEPVLESTAPAEAWVVAAQRYNDRHAELVALFNELTEGQYALADGSVSPEVIVAWQQANGVAVDGRIGPETVAAAKDGARKVPLADAVKAAVEDEAPAVEDEQ